MRIEIKEMVKVLGKELAHADDQDQADFLNAFFTELKIACSQRTGAMETQLCYISDKLTATTSLIILDLAKFIDIRSKENPNG